MSQIKLEYMIMFVFAIIGCHKFKVRLPLLQIFACIPTLVNSLPYFCTFLHDHFVKEFKELR